jgi:hypothetical protein
MVRRTSPDRKPRAGVAAVELAVLLVPLLIFWLCVIELARMIHVDQIVTSATRDAARTAAVGYSIRTDPANAANQIHYSVVRDKIDDPADGTVATSIEEVVKGHLAAHKIKVDTGIVIEFDFTTPQPPAPAPVRSTPPQPYNGIKTDRFRLKVTVPYANFRWMSITGSMGSAVACEVRWQMLVDDTFTINENIPGWSGS